MDPSGYVYDKITGGRIANATLSAYWIPYDETDGFWNEKPDEGVKLRVTRNTENFGMRANMNR